MDLDENLLLSLPSALAMTNKPIDNNDNLIPITTQNYMDKYKQLEQILADERRNNDEVKKFYKALKNDHTRMKAESLDLRSQLTNLIEENKMMQEKYKAMLDKMQQELRRKQIIIEELKNRELDEVKLERLKEDLTQEIETPYKEIVKQLENELQKLQQECNKIRFENNTLKSSSEHSKTEQNNFLDQIKMKHEVELNAIRKDRDSLRLKLQETNQAEINRVKEVVRENNQLKIKVKSLLEENEELREKLEHSEMHNNLLIRNHSKSLSDYATKISVLESEKESLKQQADNSYKETVNLNETLANTLRKLHDVERDNTTIKLNFDELQHNCKKDMANFKLDMVKERGEFNRVKESLNNQIEDMKLKIEIANNSVELQKKILEEKDRELSKTMNSVNEENWNKINELTNEKIELESKIQMITKDFEFKLNLLQIEKDKSDDKLRAFDSQREEIIRENNQLRAMFNDAESLKLEIEREQEKNRELHKKCHKYETELASNNSLEQELTEINMKLKSELSFTTNEIQKFKNQIAKLKEEFENRLAEMKTQKLTEINEYKYRYEEIQVKLTRATTKLNEVQKFHDHKKKQYQSYAKTIKTKAEILNTKIRELKLKEKATSRQTVSIEAYNKLKAHLNNLVNKHQAFRNMILNNNTSNNSNNNNNNISFNNQIEDIGHLGILNNNYISSSNNKPNFINDLNINSVLSTSSHYLIDEKSARDNQRVDQMHMQFDEITNRLDMLTSNQNEQIKLFSTSRSTYNNENNENKILDRSLNKSKLSNKTKSPSLSPVRSVKSQSVPSKNEKSFNLVADQNSLKIGRNNNAFSPIKPAKQIEVKKLSFSSSSSSSSTSDLNESVSKEIDKRNLKSAVEKKMNTSNTSIRNKKSEHSDDELKSASSPIKNASKSTVNQKEEYDDDFDASIKSKSSSDSSF